ncbi:EamA family transporter [Sneathiella sp. P13V-1]|uniref:DMT family transporter n=1 Tax=Sneathiella sp. P13V-1 TaxID=2697366 RepID=UPI00187B9CB3|nr:DMT family transporter [Sneathiella sp. P13V-1]MBE7635629.1 EamA family transporter [Sneathiella sp. P13V-1]
MTEIHRPKKLLGYLAAFSIVFIWSGWIVATRSGATSPLTIYDSTFLRFGISGLLVLPVAIYFKAWRGLTLKQILVTSQSLGIVYILVVFLAFKHAPAAHGGVFMNGVIPALTLFFGWIWFRDIPHKMQYLGATLIIVGAGMTLLGAENTATPDAWLGDILFVIAGLFFTFYMILTRLWSLTNMQIVFCSSVVNGILVVPVWYFFAPSGLDQATIADIALQGTYQGLIATLVGMLLVAFAVRHIGAPTVAAFMSAVPGVAALLGLFLLGEEFGLLGWLSLLVLTPGILITAIWNRPSKA